MFQKQPLLADVLHNTPGHVQVHPISSGQATSFRVARRHLNGLSSELEKRLLIWLAQRIPARVNSDHLTGLGFISMFLVGACYAAARWSHHALLLSTVFLALNWLGDSLDGTLARVRKRERPRYGFYVDHMLDAFGALFLAGGLAISGYVDWRVASGVLIAFLMLSTEVYLATYTLGVFRLSFGGLGATELRLVLAAGNIALWRNPLAGVPHTTYRLFDFGGCIAIAALSVMLLIIVPRHVLQLYREERWKS